jgi:hypothetical protein
MSVRETNRITTIKIPGLNKFLSYIIYKLKSTGDTVRLFYISNSATLNSAKIEAAMMNDCTDMQVLDHSLTFQKVLATCPNGVTANIDMTLPAYSTA